MIRNLYLLLGAAGLIAMAACSVKSETKGAGGGSTTTTHSTTTNTGTGGGGGSCVDMTCAAYFAECAGANGCPSDPICDGTAADAWDALAGCICDACLASCPDDVCPGGTGQAADCETCQATALSQACTADYSTCAQN